MPWINGLHAFIEMKNNFMQSVKYEFP